MSIKKPITLLIIFMINKYFLDWSEYFIILNYSIIS